jgi:hypothetical protein
VQQLSPGLQAHAVQQKQQAVTQAWEALRLCMEQRRAQLEQACLLGCFHTVVRASSAWGGGACVCERVYSCMCMCVHALQFQRENKCGRLGVSLAAQRLSIGGMAWQGLLKFGSVPTQMSDSAIMQVPASTGKLE